MYIKPAAAAFDVFGLFHSTGLASTPIALSNSLFLFISPPRTVLIMTLPRCLKVPFTVFNSFADCGVGCLHDFVVVVTLSVELSISFGVIPVFEIVVVKPTRYCLVATNVKYFRHLVKRKALFPVEEFKFTWVWPLTGPRMITTTIS